MTRLRVNFSHLKEHKFKHNFQDLLNSLCPCSLQAWHTYPFYIGCQIFSNQLNILFVDLNEISSDILKISENVIVRVSIFGKKGLIKDMGLRIIACWIRFIKDSVKRKIWCIIFFLKRKLFDIFSRHKKFKIFFHLLYQCFIEPFCCEEQ